MELSLSAAARATGRSKSTIGRAIKAGKLSARRDDTGNYHIDASELARAFGWDPSGGVPHHVTAPVGPEIGPSIPVAVLEAKLALLEEALGREREALAHEREALSHERGTTADLRQRLDRSDERVRALLGQATATPSPAPTRSFLARLLGR
jgi:FtsZ-binding cell division protein ZapB